MKKPLMLMILDGWGINPCSENNAVAMAKAPNLAGYLQEFPHAQIKTSGMAQGLPEGQMGNSEVGHLNLGAGRVVYQDFTRITNQFRMVISSPIRCCWTALPRSRPAEDDCI